MQVVFYQKALLHNIGHAFERSKAQISKACTVPLSRDMAEEFLAQFSETQYIHSLVKYLSFR